MKMIWTHSHPRDYTHGPLNMIVYVVPYLQNHCQAAVACNNCLNVVVLNGNSEFIHTYVWTCNYFVKPANIT